MSTPFDHAQLMQGLGNFLQTPLARGAIRYWWVTMPLGLLGYHYWIERKKAGEATIGNLVKDMVPAIGLVGTMLTLNAMMEKQEAAKAAAPKPSPIPAGSPIRDAEFSTTKGPVAASIV